MALLIRTDGTAEATQSTQKQVNTGTAAAESGGDKVNTAASKAVGKATDTKADTSAPKPAGIGMSAADGGVDFSALNASYEGKYDQQLADLYNQIVNRKPFEYNSSDDQFYQQYVDRYTNGGQMAMMDTMGQAAELTGGYGSSYGQRVGQQTYDEYMSGLNDRALELEQRAYGRYQDQGALALQNYDMLVGLDNRDYGRFTDDYSRTADKYEIYLSEAAARADRGDFSGFAQLYGDEAANAMKASWVATTLMPLYQQGLMDAETYYSIAGVYPVGYNANGAAGSSAGGAYWGAGSGSGAGNANTINDAAAIIKGYYEPNRDRTPIASTAGSNKVKN